MRWLIAVLFVLALPAAHAQPPAPATGLADAAAPPKMVTLTSGKRIKVLRVGLIHFQEAPPGLAMAYETDLKISDKDALRAEATEIWQDFRRDAEKAKVQSAIVMANEKPQGFIVTANKSYNFVFERLPDGTWPSKAK